MMSNLDAYLYEWNVFVEMFAKQQKEETDLWFNEDPRGFISILIITRLFKHEQKKDG